MRGSKSNHRSCLFMVMAFSNPKKFSRNKRAITVKCQNNLNKYHSLIELITSRCLGNDPERSAPSRRGSPGPEGAVKIEPTL